MEPGTYGSIIQDTSSEILRTTQSLLRIGISLLLYTITARFILAVIHVLRVASMEYFLVADGSYHETSHTINKCTSTRLYILDSMSI